MQGYIIKRFDSRYFRKANVFTGSAMAAKQYSTEAGAHAAAKRAGISDYTISTYEAELGLGGNPMKIIERNIHAWGKLHQQQANGDWKLVCGGSLETLEHVAGNMRRKNADVATRIILDPAR